MVAGGASAASAAAAATHVPAPVKEDSAYNAPAAMDIENGNATREPRAVQDDDDGSVDGKHPFWERIVGERIHDKFSPYAKKFRAPGQVKAKHRRAVKVLGRIGWVAKGVTYGILGGLVCKSAVSDKEDENLASPQGAFILVGNNNAGKPLLIIMCVGIGTYAIWRFWEGITGQGTDAKFNNFKNFFKYRLSPLVSGAVYTAYMVFILTVIPLDKDDTEAKNRNNFVNTWNKTTLGRIGLALLGVAFTIAAVVQLQGVLTPVFHSELRRKETVRYRWVWWLTVVLGHLGFLGRFGVFLGVAILFYRSIGGDVSANTTTISDGLAQLQNSTAGRVALMIMGIALIIYAAFAFLAGVYTRIFPTPPPSGVVRAPSKVHRHHHAPAGGHAADGAVPAASVPARVTRADGSTREIHVGGGHGGSHVDSDHVAPDGMSIPQGLAALGVVQSSRAQPASPRRMRLVGADGPVI